MSHLSCVKLLLQKGADTELCDSRGLTPLDVVGEVVYRPNNIEGHGDEFISEPFSPKGLRTNRKRSSVFSDLPIFKTYGGESSIQENENK